MILASLEKLMHAQIKVVDVTFIQIEAIQEILSNAAHHEEHEQQ